MPPLAVIEPNPVWHRRAGVFSLCFLALVLVGGYFVPLILILAPFVAFRGIHALQFLKPGRVGIFLYEDRIVCKPAFGKKREIKKADVVRFLAVYRATTEVVVARTRDVSVRGTQNRALMHPSDIVMPSGLMRNPGLVRRLESWRSDSFSTDSLFPGAVTEPKAS